MQIIITSVGEGKIPEWSVVELQGDLNANHRAAIQGKIIGDLHYNKDGEPMLIIGHHVLAGKESKFEKPLAILKKVPGKLGEVTYEVQGMLRRKLIFSDRPRPIVASTECGNQEAPAS